MANSTNQKQSRVVLWCVPRSSSTVISKCLCGIEDIKVFSELYSYATVCRGMYTTATSQTLPAEFNGNERVFEEANDICEKKFGYRFPSRRLSYTCIERELTNTTNQCVFIKEMAYPVDSFRSFLPAGFKHTFMIRDPSRCFQSFRRAMASQFEDMLSPDFDIVQDDVAKVKPMTWFEALHDFWRYVVDNIDPNPVIIDAYDLLSRPGPTLRAYCKAVDFPYSDDLLQWEAGLGMPENMEMGAPQLYATRAAYAFYGNALKSTHFMAPKESGSIPRDLLTDDIIRCVDHSMPFYREMYANTLKI